MSKGLTWSVDQTVRSQQFEGVNFEKNRMEEQFAGRGTLSRVFAEAALNEVLLKGVLQLLNGLKGRHICMVSSIRNIGA
jgi:hypothetical protein